MHRNYTKQWDRDRERPTKGKEKGITNVTQLTTSQPANYQVNLVNEFPYNQSEADAETIIVDSH